MSKLTLFELSLFETAGITVSSNEVLVWPSLQSPKFTVSSQFNIRSTKHNNSGVKYVDSRKCVHWGIVEKFLSFSHGTQSYGIISELIPLPNQICKDKVTNAQLQKHLVICQPIRLVHMHANTYLCAPLLNAAYFVI